MRRLYNLHQTKNCRENDLMCSIMGICGLYEKSDLKKLRKLHVRGFTFSMEFQT
jgi:hypothetical protein